MTNVVKATSWEYTGSDGDTYRVFAKHDGSDDLLCLLINDEESAMTPEEAGAVISMLQMAIECNNGGANAK